MNGLTPRQGEVFAFIQAYVGEHGYAPTFDEIRKHTGLRGKSGIHRLLSGLEDRGVIRRLPNRSRAIEIVEDRGSGFHLKRILDAVSCSGFIGVTDPIIAEAQSFIRRAV